MRFGLLLIALSCGFAAGDAYIPLITDNSLQHFIGDKQHWVFRDGVLAGEYKAPVQDAGFLLAAERFRDFSLTFSARCRIGRCGMLVRGTIQPPTQVVGYRVAIGTEPGSIGFRTPGRFNLVAMKAEAQQEVSLAPADSAASSDSWMLYDVAAAGDRITVKVNGKQVAEAMESRGFHEGMIGFQLGPGGPASLEVKDLRIKLHEDFDRKRGQAWVADTDELLKLARSAEGFRPLFDGASLNGWRDATAFWTVLDGLITGKPHNSFLVTADEYSNFVLKASVRLFPNSGNSGIQIRSQVIPDGMRGYQVDIGDPWWGHLYVESTQRGILIPVDDRKKRKELVRAEDWNDFVIVCRNDHILAELNGTVTADLMDHYGEKSGRIGLQIHVGPPMKVEFRNVLIRVLP